jgi:hypothetical protein
MDYIHLPQEKQHKIMPMLLGVTGLEFSTLEQSSHRERLIG